MKHLKKNHSSCSWAQEFLNQENQGLDVLVDYLSVANSAVTYVSAELCFLSPPFSQSVLKILTLEGHEKFSLCVTAGSASHRYDMDAVDNGSLPADKGKNMDKSLEDLSRSASNSPTHSALKATKAFTVRYHQHCTHQCVCYGEIHTRTAARIIR